MEKDFYIFFQKTIRELNPGIEKYDFWYLEYLAELLSSIEQTKEKYLIINIPPRFFKSSLVSVSWPLWLLGNKPEKKIIVATYSQRLSNKFNTDSKIITETDWYQKQYPQFALHKSSDKFKLLTKKNGFRLSTSTGGTLTGEGGDYLILDDPHHPKEIFSPHLREKTISWFQQIFSTRLNNHRKGKIVLIMQRLHKDDLTGFLLSRNKNIRHINLPAIFNEKKTFHLKKKTINITKNSLLAKNRYTKKELDELREEIGIHTFTTQFLGTPVTQNGSILRSSFLQFEEITTNENDLIIHSWDTAICSNEKSDFSVVTSWSIREQTLLLLDYKRLKLDFPELKSRIESYALKENANIILIEAKASGVPLIEEMKRRELPVHGIIPIHDKKVRFIAACNYFELGKIKINIRLKHDNIFLNELLSFPDCKNDDIVDSISQFINWYHKKKEKIIRRII